MYQESANKGQKIIIEMMIKPRMDELNISAYRLSKITGISEATLSRWLSGKNDITLKKFLQILGALDIQPYFHTDSDKEDFQYIHFN